MSSYPQVPQQISDPISENLAKLRELFPAAVKDGALDVDALRAELGDFEEVRPGDESYELNWVGKKEAKKEAFKPLLGKTLALKDDGKHADTTGNLYIEGDNLEALKLLRQNYYGEVKMIYIDPPYNTGKDFVYTDKFAVNAGESEAEEGAVTAEGQRLIKNERTSNRFHARWLDMMYPRLKLAKELLREDGFIVISIDDAEINNLGSLADEIFGAENRIAVLVWDRNRKNDAKFFSVGHEYMAVYARSKEWHRIHETELREPQEGIGEARLLFATLKEKHGDDWIKIQDDWRDFFRGLSSNDERKKLGRFSKVGPKGPYRDDGNINWPGGGGPRYAVRHPDTGKECKQPVSGWRFPTKLRFDEEVAAGRIVFGSDESTVPRVVSYLFETRGKVMQSVHFSYAQTASVEFEKLMDGKLFDNPKPSFDLFRMVRLLTERADLIIDFFSGSATTAHAVMQLNAEDGGKRRFIMVQLPEVCAEDSEAAKAGYKTIAEIGKERIRRAGEKIKEELKAKQAEGQKKQALAAKKGSQLALENDGEATEEPNPYVLDPDSLDIGFKSFRIEETKINWLKKDLRGEQLEFDDTTTQDALDFVPGYTDTDVVYELMLRQSNIPLTHSITRPIASAPRSYLYADSYLICLEETITRELVESLAALEPTPTKYFFRDSAFGKDIALKDETFRRLKAEIHKHHGDLGSAYTVEFI